MSIAEILVIILVALIAFGPDRLPELAKILAKFYKKYQYLQERSDKAKDKLTKHLALIENEAKAASVDKKYQNKSKDELFTNK